MLHYLEHLVELFLSSIQVRGRMLSTTTAIIHWDEPEEPNGQVVGYRVYYTSNNMLPVNQVCPQLVLFGFIIDLITTDR